jgi:hypothetical protein
MHLADHDAVAEDFDRGPGGIAGPHRKPPRIRARLPAFGGEAER